MAVRGNFRVLTSVRQGLRREKTGDCGRAVEFNFRDGAYIIQSITYRSVYCGVHRRL